MRLDYSQEDQRTVARHSHTGPLRILQSLYPEGDAVCHNVLIHPPGGLVGGDTLNIEVSAQPHSHGLITTPGATRFYRSDGLPAMQATRIAVASDARIEWLPHEAIAYSGCRAENHLTAVLEPGGELLGWDICALGLPLAGLPFVHGHVRQHLEMPGVWRERGVLDAQDNRLLQSPVGLAGNACLATLLFLTGTALPKARRDALLECARARISNHALAATAGATCPHPQVVLVRVLAPVVEPAMALLRQVRNDWRSLAWGLPPESPRIWSM